MCGIAGIIDLSGQRRPVSAGAVHDMASAIVHRGPDEDGFLEEPGLAFASRRLSIVGLADGRQPIRNEDGSVAVVFNGELFDYPEQKQELEGKGHRFATHCDTEVIPHRWEDHLEGMFEYLRGQFAIALYDARRRRVVLARDRFGICPLYWTVCPDAEGGWLLFASEIKALLASGMVEARPDPRGINHVFTFFALPGPVTCFEGVRLLTPGHYIDIHLGGAGEPSRVQERTYWQIDFPDEGDEDYHSSPRQLTDRFEELLSAAVERRLRADVPVVSYLSGGVDSSVVVALASRLRGQPIPAFTVRVTRSDLDESGPATLVAHHVGTEPIVVRYGPEEILNTYPALIRAAEAPVVDTACAALLLLAAEVHRHGYKVALTGEGADEWLAGYPWHKLHRVLGSLAGLTGPRLSQLIRRAFLRLSGAPYVPWTRMERVQDIVGGHNGWLDVYGLMTLSRYRFFSPAMREQLNDHVPYADLGLNSQRLRRWHPLNRELCLGGRVQLGGLLLSSKGDRVAMNSSVETRYPFLDEAVFEFLAKVPPTWKLHGLRDKFLLRRVAQRWLPRSIAWRRKAMFRAPFDSFYQEPVPPFIEQLLSPESLRRTGYFDPAAVARWRHDFRRLARFSSQRVSIEMGLVAVLATQLWHHTYIDGSLADLPTQQGALRNGECARGNGRYEMVGGGLQGPHFRPSPMPVSSSQAGGG
jgi:asparagine synthase (glutamine-hydrolysing)